MRLPPHWLAYVPAFVVLVLAVLFLVLRARSEATTTAVNHSHQVITEVDRLLASLSAAESRQRGYLLTGDTSYLRVVGDPGAEVRGHMARLRELAADDAGQQERLNVLERAIEAQVDDLTATIALYDSAGPTAAMSVVRTDRGQDLMSAIRRTVEEIRREEDRRLAARVALGGSEERRAFLVLVIGSLLAAAVSYLISRQLGAAAETQGALARTLEHQNRRLGDQAEAMREQTTRLEETAQKLESSNSDLHRANDDLIRVSVEADVARQLAEEANQAKSQFLATMSHELRTPLNAIGGYAELVDLGVHGPVTDAQRHALERIQVAQRHLLGLINDLLNFAKLEAGRVEYRITDIDVPTLADEVISLLTPQVRDRQITAACGSTHGLIARADAERLQQILLNLLSNAVKFSDPGDSIRVECSADDGFVRIRVVDSGHGIPAEKLEAVFDPFVQVTPNLTGDGGRGAGLGLAISRELARGMGGELVAESVLGEGSVFTLTVPKSEAARPATQAAV